MGLPCVKDVGRRSAVLPGSYGFKGLRVLVFGDGMGLARRFAELRSTGLKVRFELTDVSF